LTPADCCRYKTHPMAVVEELEFLVITPERQVLHEITDSLVIPAHDGEVGVLPGRAPLLCELGVGQLRFSTIRGARRYFIDGGFAQVYQNRVTVLTDRAVAADEIDSDIVREAQQQADDLPLGEQRARANRRVSVLRRMHRPA
jgi:F-type H+-transporting ATPase subunit epsilon